VAGFWRHLAALLAATTLAASSLLAAQPAAAATSYTVNVTFDNVKFPQTDDGCFTIFCATDPWLEIYGNVGAFTTAGVSSAGGLPYRIFGKWGYGSCEVDWSDKYGGACPKDVVDGPKYGFKDVFLCSASSGQACSTGYTKSNNAIALQVHPGEQFAVTTLMYDYDSGSADDLVCSAYMWFGPYTDAELQAKKYVTDGLNRSLWMGNNGSAECFVAFHLT
jgi:hypothetical protein